MGRLAGRAGRAAEKVLCSGSARQVSCVYVENSPTGPTPNGHRSDYLFYSLVSLPPKEVNKYIRKEQ
jgi:hypothetical protein